MFTRKNRCFLHKIYCCKRRVSFERIFTQVKGKFLILAMSTEKWCICKWICYCLIRFYCFILLGFYSFLIINNFCEQSTSSVLFSLNSAFEKFDVNSLLSLSPLLPSCWLPLKSWLRKPTDDIRFCHPKREITFIAIYQEDFSFIWKLNHNDFCINSLAEILNARDLMTQTITLRLG